MVVRGAELGFKAELVTQSNYIDGAWWALTLIALVFGGHDSGRNKQQQQQQEKKRR